jgi:TonB family protein
MLLATATGCTTPGSDDTLEGPQGELARAVSAYQAYARDDCAEVQRQLDANDLDSWFPGEPQFSFRLLGGFCAERAGDVEGAREIYEEIARRAPLSFASDDARERLRVLRTRESDPDYDQRLEEARSRAAQGSSGRVAIERTPAGYPPMAHHAALSGQAVVEFEVTRDGATRAPIVVDSSPPLLFDGAALRAVRSWRYATRDADTVGTRQAIRMRFRPETRAPAEAAAGGRTSDSSDGAVAGEASDAP